MCAGVAAPVYCTRLRMQGARNACLGQMFLGAMHMRVYAVAGFCGVRAHILRTPRCRVCACCEGYGLSKFMPYSSRMHSCMRSLFIQCWGTRVGEFNLFIVSACFWRGRLCFGRGRDRGFVLYISLFFAGLGWWVCVCLYTRIHTHKLLGYSM